MTGDPILENTEAVEAKETKKLTDDESQLSLDPQAEKIKADLAKARKENEDMKRQIESMRLKKLKESEDKEAYIQEVEKQRDQAIRDRQMYSEAYLEDRKTEAVKVEAIKLGMAQEFLEVLEKMGTEGIEVETTSTGKVNIIGAHSFVARLKSKYPRMFESKGSKVNSDSPSTVEAEELSYEKLMKLKEKADKSGNSKSPEWKAYGDALKKYASKAN